MFLTIKQIEGQTSYGTIATRSAAIICLAIFVYCPASLAQKAEPAQPAQTPQAETKPIDQASDTVALGPLELDDAETAKKPRRKAKECRIEAASGEWVDRVRSRTHTGLCFTADWIDGLFGDEHQFDGESFRGKISLGFRQDETEGFDPRLRVRIKTKLPNMSKRFNAFIGRVEEDSFISNTEVDQDQVNAVGLRSTNDDDSEWLIGIGYRDPESQGNGFDVSVGAKLSSGLSPYAKLAHRHLFEPSDNNYWRTTQTVFWRKEDGFGVSSSLDYTRILGDHDIFEWDTSIKLTEERDDWEWITSGTWHHEFTRQKGVSSRAYVRGERDNPVSIPEFGLSFTYVRPFLRDWLYVETGVDFRWEKEDAFQEEYKSAIRFGLQFQMLLGDYYKLGRDN